MFKGCVHSTPLTKEASPKLIGHPSDSGAMAKRRKSSSPISGKFVCMHIRSLDEYTGRW